MTGCVHGDEWGSCEILLNLASDLLQAQSGRLTLQYGEHQVPASAIDELLQARDLVLVPIVNPDGRHASQTDPRFRRYRRNARPNQGVPFAAGVDINRNFDFVFDEQSMHADARDPDRGDPRAENHRGPQAGSEPETRNIDDLPAIHWLVDLHFPGECICHPWGIDELQSTEPGMNYRSCDHHGSRGLYGDAYKEFLCAEDRDRFTRLSHRLAEDIKKAGGPTFTTGPLFNHVPVLGTCMDYAYARHLDDAGRGKVLPFLIEWCKSDNQPQPVDMTTIARHMAGGLIGFCLQTLSDH
jgi:murein tripeptide amidase MpaA